MNIYDEANNGPLPDYGNGPDPEDALIGCLSVTIIATIAMVAILLIDYFLT